MLLLRCCGVCKPAPILLLCVLLLCAAGLWYAVCLVLLDSAAWTVSCVLLDGVCLGQGVQNHFGQHFIKKYLIGKGLFRQHKKWFFGSYRKWPFLTGCFRQHKKWPQVKESILRVGYCQFSKTFIITVLRQ